MKHGLIAVSFVAGTALAQMAGALEARAEMTPSEMTPSETFDRLSELGVFEGSLDGDAPDYDMSREDFTRLMSQLIGDREGEQPDQPSFSDVPSFQPDLNDFYDDYSGWKDDGGIENGVNGSPDKEVLILVLVKATGDPGLYREYQERRLNGEDDMDGFVDDLVENIIEKGKLSREELEERIAELDDLEEENDGWDEALNEERERARRELESRLDQLETNRNETRLEDEVREEAQAPAEPSEPSGPLPGYPDWADFPETAAGNLTPDSIVNAGSGCSAVCQAIYTGRIEGQSASGQDITGDISMNYDFAAGQLTDGDITFDGGAGYVLLYGVPGSDSAPVAAVVSDGEYRGGLIDLSGEVSGAFFGASAEEMAGQWQFEVPDGADPGALSGMFAGAR